jgi:hypothetical protein
LGGGVLRGGGAAEAHAAGSPAGRTPRVVARPRPVACRIPGLPARPPPPKARPPYPHPPSPPQLPLPFTIEDITLGPHSLLDAEHLDTHAAKKAFSLGDFPIRVAGMKVGVWVGC